MFISVPDEKIELVKSLLPRLQEISGVRIIYDERKKIFEIDPTNENPYSAFKAASVIRALGLGFSVNDAMKLMSDEYQLEVIDLKATLGGNPDTIRRIKGRIIGEGGKAKKILQEYTSAVISIYEHYVGIISTNEQTPIVRKAIDMLIEGREHSTVYKFLDKAEADLVRQFSKNRPNYLK
ncbi:MAG: RNA-processing protein [Candidatus Aramenus sp.]|nr:RNA-processing protein [Candidatus Aramenus sp.]